MSEEINEAGGLISLIGGVIAAIMSWGTNHSVLWAIFHFICGWIYVIYHCIMY